MNVYLLLVVQCFGIVCEPGKIRIEEATMRAAECRSCGEGTYSNSYDAKDCIACTFPSTAIQKDATKCKYYSKKTCSQLGWTGGLGSGNICGQSVIKPLESTGSGSCIRAATYQDANEFCKEAGGRLCTAWELRNNEVIDTGCNMNHDRIWTSDLCPAEEGCDCEGEADCTCGTNRGHISAGAAFYATIAPTPSPSHTPTYQKTVVTGRPTLRPTWNPTIPAQLSTTPRPTEAPSARPTSKPTRIPTPFPTGYPTPEPKHYKLPNCTANPTKLAVRCCADQYEQAKVKKEEQKEAEEEPMISKSLMILICSVGGFITLVIVGFVVSSVLDRRKNRDRDQAIVLIESMKDVDVKMRDRGIALSNAKRKLSSALKKIKIMEAVKANKIVAMGAPEAATEKTKRGADGNTDREALSLATIVSGDRSVFKKQDLPPLMPQGGTSGAPVTIAPPLKKIPHWKSGREVGVGVFAEGDEVNANYKGKGEYYKGKIVKVNDDGSCDIRYNDGTLETCVAGRQVRAVLVQQDGSPAKQVKAGVPDLKRGESARVVKQNSRFARATASKFRVGQQVKADYKNNGRLYKAVVVHINHGIGSLEVRYVADGITETLPEASVHEVQEENKTEVESTEVQKIEVQVTEQEAMKEKSVGGRPLTLFEKLTAKQPEMDAPSLPGSPKSTKVDEVKPPGSAGSKAFNWGDYKFK